MVPPASYGDVTGEYRALVEESAVVEPAHDLVWVEGPDAASFLQGLVSQDVMAMPTGSVMRSFLLSPQGKLNALLWLLKGEGRVGVVTDPGCGEQVAAALTRYRIRVDAEVNVDDRARYEVWGPEVEGEGWLDDQGVLRAHISFGGLGRALVAGGQAPTRPRAGSMAVTAVRVELGEPLMGRDVDESTIPQETGLAGAAVSFTKGCYLGQELAARIDSRGHVNRHLRGILITRNVLPPEGAAVVWGGREVGAMTSVAESLRVGAPIGLGLIRREVEEGSEVLVRWEDAEAPAIVRALPLV